MRKALLQRRALLEPFVRRRRLTFAVGAAMVAAGVLLANRAYRSR